MIYISAKTLGIYRYLESIAIAHTVLRKYIQI